MTQQKTAFTIAGMRLTFLSVIGALVFIVGVGIATIPGTGLRGSGLGTVCIIAGVVLVAYDFVRTRQKSP